MGLSENEGASSQQPEEGLLPLLGDMLFAGAILVMMYPCMSRTIKRIDLHFCRQVWLVTEVIVPLVALSFVLMLMIAQQTRVTYCSLVRPFVGAQPEDGGVYAGILLKVLFCALLVVNYFCASRLQRLVIIFFPNFQTRETSDHGRAFSPTTSWSGRSEPPTFSNNSNTNSPTTTYSDIFSTISSSTVPDSASFEDQSHTAESQPRLYCDVGTMVRFPEYQTNLCNLQFCQASQVIHPSTSGSDQRSPFPDPLCPSSTSPHLHSPIAGSSGFCAFPSTKLYQDDPADSHSSHHLLGNGWVPVAPANVTSNCQGSSSGFIRVPSKSKSKTRLTSAWASCRKSASSTSNKGNLPKFFDQYSETGSCPLDPGHPPVAGSKQNVTNAAGIRRSMSSAAVFHTCGYHCPLSVPCSSNSASSRAAARQRSFSGHVVKRRYELPTMIKMTRSGKIYGYG